MSFPKWRTLVVEDEASVRQELIDALNESPEFEVAGWAASLHEGVELVGREPAEVLFLDIKLIGGDAFQLLSHLKAAKTPIPPVVINTGFREFGYAQKLHNDFGKEVIFILKKPFWEDWEKHRDRIVEAIYAHKQAERLAGAQYHPQRLLSIPSGAHQSHLVNLDDIIKVITGAKGKGNIEIIFQHHTLVCNISLAQLLVKLPPEFIQINRFEAINIQWITLVNQAERQVHLRNGTCCDIGNPFYKHLMDALPK
jgi:DNA-binding LytR/AlgR family response regulator